MKDLNLDDVEIEPTDEELHKYNMILDSQLREFEVQQENNSSDMFITRNAIECIECLTKLISTNITFDDVLQGAINKQLTKFVKALTIEPKGDSK